MGIERCPRHGAGGGARLCPTFRLTLGATRIELARDGAVRVVGPEVAVYRDLRSFLANALSKGGVR